MKTQFKATNPPSKRKPKTADLSNDKSQTVNNTVEPAKVADKPQETTPDIIKEMDQFIAGNGIKKKDFYAKLGYSGTYIQKVRNGTRELNDDLAGVIEKTIASYFKQEPDEDDDIEAMSHSRLWNEIVHNGMSFTFRASDPLWQEAFRRYNEAHNSNLKPNCPGCFKKVKDWIKRV